MDGNGDYTLGNLYWLHGLKRSHGYYPEWKEGQEHGYPLPESMDLSSAKRGVEDVRREGLGSMHSGGEGETPPVTLHYPYNTVRANHGVLKGARWLWWGFPVCFRTCRWLVAVFTSYLYWLYFGFSFILSFSSNILHCLDRTVILLNDVNSFQRQYCDP